MNISKKMLIVGAMIFINTFSEAKQTNIEDKNVSVKCHIELLGGTERIYFRVLPEKQFANLPMILVGKKMVTSTKKQEKIHKVHECVLLDDDFTSSSSKLIDEQTAR